VADPAAIKAARPEATHPIAVRLGTAGVPDGPSDQSVEFARFRLG